MKWCAKCGCHVGHLHRHWGTSDYIRTADGGWGCRWCRQPLKNNNVDCKCGLRPKETPDHDSP